MGAPSSPHFKLEQTFFGFKPADRVKFHESIFEILWYCAGRLSWDDIYHMPLFLRRFYIKKINKLIEEENERIQKATENSKRTKSTNKNTPQNPRR